MDANLTNLKLHLNIDSGDTLDDTLLNNYLGIATIGVNNYLNFTTGDTITSDIQSSINSAIILLSSHYYSNRNMVSMGNNASDMPYTFKFLLDFYKNPIVQ